MFDFDNKTPTIVLGLVLFAIVIAASIWWQVERTELIGATNCADIAYSKYDSFTRCQCPDGSVIEFSGPYPTTPCD